MKTVSEVSRLTGVSVRALHLYHEQGLLIPTEITPAGYRLYDDAALAKLQTILLFRELGFPLKEIKRITGDPSFDTAAALREQIKLLSMERDRIDGIIAAAEKMISERKDIMDMKVFDRSEIDKYTAEAKERWGNTDAYRECDEKYGSLPADKKQNVNEGLMDFFVRFGAMKDSPADSPAAQALADELRAYITANYYDCARPVFAGLGEMYSADERMKANIDSAGGEGTAEYASSVIRIYCR